MVHDTEESAARALSFQLSRQLPVDTKVTPVRRTAYIQNIAQIEKDDIIVPIGVDSFRDVCMVTSQGVVMALFVGKEEYENIQARCSVSTSAVFSGAPLEKRLVLLQAVWLDRKPLAVLHSDTLLLDEQGMTSKAAEYGFKLLFFPTPVDRLSVLKSVNFVLEDASMIMALVDTQLYQQGIAQDILRLLFHKRQVIIGPSLPFVRAGSLFAIYSDTEAKLATLVNHLTLWQKQGVFHEARYPDKLRVSFNPYLIKSHSVVLPSASYLKEQYGLCSDIDCR
nr:hypothetical protein [Marinomonas algarum]